MNVKGHQQQNLSRLLNAAYSNKIGIYGHRGPDTSASRFSADWLVAGFAEGDSREPTSECRDGPWSIPNTGRTNVRFGS